MKIFNALIMGVIFMVVSSCAQKMDIEVEKEQVKAVLDQYVKMLETEDMEVFSKIVAHDEDMVNFGTDANERLVGWEELKELMQKQFASTENSKLSIKDRVIKVHESGKVAWFSEIIDWNLESQGQEVELKGLRTTGVLEKREENWIIMQLHYSIPVGEETVQN